MNTPTFTEGPWRHGKSAEEGSYYVEAHPDLNGGYEICHLIGPDAEANAKAIAGYPELLSILREIKDLADAEQDDNECNRNPMAVLETIYQKARSIEQ